jgi:RimJ/RimL family protein N-acetyltransferase
VASALGFAFQTIGVGRVEGRAGQAPELELVRRIGGVAEGVLRGSCLVADGFGDQTLWSVLDSEWGEGGHGRAIGPVRKEWVTPLPEGLPAGAGDQPPAWTTQLPLLKGSLVTLREIDMVDGPVLLRALEPADLEISIEPPPKTRDDFRRYIAWVRIQRMMGRAAGFAIVPRGSRHAAGLIQVRRDAASGMIAEWGIVLATRYRGSGAAVEAVQLMAGFAFESVDVQRLEARTSAIDSRTVGLLRKIGAVREARLRRSFVLGDRALDDDLWAILKSDWRNTSAAADFRTHLKAVSAAG